MTSESTSAFGQPSETNPTRGVVAAGCGRFTRWITVDVMGGCSISRRKKTGPCARLLRRFERLALFLLVRFSLLRSTEIGEGERREHTPGLVLHPLLHVHEELGALLQVVAEHPLHRRRLHLHE